jgi:hypothetical protein
MVIPVEHTPLLDIRNRLSISYALATSVKLGSFEVCLDLSVYVCMSVCMYVCVWFCMFVCIYMSVLPDDDSVSTPLFDIRFCLLMSHALAATVRPVFWSLYVHAAECCMDTCGWS